MIITAFYAALLTLLFAWLTLRVVKLRHRFKVPLGDGNNPALRNAISAHNNAAQYIPFTLLLLLLLEMALAPALLVHLFGLSLLAGRLIHARGLLSEQLKLRVRGMQLTLFALLGAALTNLLYLVI